MSVDQSLRESIADLIEKIDVDSIHDYRIKRISVYRTGFLTRIEQTNYAINKLTGLLEDLTKDSESGPEKTEIYFYSDSFWGFLYSSIDIFAQFLNQLMKFEIDEKDVSYLGILNHLNQTIPNHDLTSILSEIKRSNAYINAAKYRHCLTHRRSIAINQEAYTKQILGGYHQNDITLTDSIPVTEVVLYTCENPTSVLNPKFTQERKIPDYLIDSRRILFEKLEKAITKIEIR